MKLITDFFKIIKILTMAILSSTGVSGFLSSAKATGKQILNKAGKLIPEYIEDFVSGFAGHGWKIWNYRTEEDSEGKKLEKYKLEIDSITVRESMTIFELLIQKIRAVKGALSITQASGKVATAIYDEIAGEWLLTVEDEMSFVAHDIIRCQSWENGTLKGYWVEISEIRKIKDVDTIVIPVSEFSGGIGYDKENNNAECVDKTLTNMVTPDVGDEIIQFGNSEAPNRQSAVYIHADEGGQPAIDILFGIITKSFAKCLKTRIGGDIPGSNGAKGFYCENGMIKCVDDDSKSLIYEFRPDGSFSLGKRKIVYDTKEDKLRFGAGVTLTWDNLADDVQEGLKGEAAVIYELILDTEIFVMNASGLFTPNYVCCNVKKTVGTTSILMTAEDIEADGLSLGWVRDDSGFISISPGGYVTPHNDCFPIVFYLKRGNTFICSKTVVTVENGSPGEVGVPGEDAVIYEIITPVSVVHTNKNGSSYPSSMKYSVRKTIGSTLIDIITDAAMSAEGLTLNYLTPMAEGFGEGYSPWLIDETMSAQYFCDGIKLRLLKGNSLVSQKELPELVDGRDGSKGDPGVSIYKLDLTNDNASVSCDSNGNILSLSDLKELTKSIVQLFWGTSEVNDATYAVNFKFDFTHYTFTPNGNGMEFKLTNMPVGFDPIVATFTASVSGVIVATSVMTITKVCAGADGIPATVYYLACSPSLFSLDKNGDFKNGNTLMIKAYKKTGISDPVICADGEVFISVRNDRNDDPVTSTSGTLTISADSNSSSILVLLKNSERTIILDEETIPILVDGQDGQPGLDADVPDWLKKWNGYATELGEDYIVTPKMFSGTKTIDAEGNVLLTGIAQGKECITIDGVKRTGIFALVDNEIVFELDPINKKYAFKGRVEADSGIFTGSIATPFIEINDDNYLSYFTPLSDGSGYILNISRENGFNYMFGDGLTKENVAIILPYEYINDGVELNIVRAQTELSFLVVKDVCSLSDDKEGNIFMAMKDFVRLKCVVFKRGNLNDSDIVKRQNIKWIHLSGGSLN